MHYSDDELRKKLTPAEYKIAVEGATEMPFTGKHLNNDKKGIYVDIISGKPLFSSLDKFDSGCGWPSFSKPISQEAIYEKEDGSFNRKRTEIRSSQAQTHLGHVFEDGPEELGGLRYCINSAVLKFIAFEDMEKEGYGEYKYVFDDEK